jgi:uncharacterized protein
MIAMAVMAKAPQVGHTKTRLSPPLDPAGAAALSAAFLRDITENIATAAREAPIVGGVAYAPAGTAALFEGLIADGSFLLLADGSASIPAHIEGIGRSLLHAVQGMLAAGHSAACMVNADSPTLPTSFLCTTAAALTQPGERVVLGPAEDGGYYLLGIKKAHVHLFEDIAWSTPLVAEQTKVRARTLGLDLLELPPWYDVDDRDGLSRLMYELRRPSRAAFPAPATVACLKRLGLLPCTTTE